MTLLDLRWTALAALSSLAVACSDPAPSTTDAGTTDNGVVDAGTPDTGTAVDRPSTDVPSTDVPSTDVPATDVPSTDVGMDVPSTDVGGDAGSVCASAVAGAACSVAGQACGGPCSDPCQFCNILRCEGGRWTRLEVFPMPCTDSGAGDAARVDVPAAMPGARMLWEGPGGFTGLGPAVMVDADGTVRIWENSRGVNLETPSSPTRTLMVTPTAAADLFARWASVDRSGLPHAGGGAECSGRAAFRACAGSDCRVESLSFQRASQLSPEMDSVRMWFEDNLTGEGTAMARPANYCRF
jgi:hypothetical protein